MRTFILEGIEYENAKEWINSHACSIRGQDHGAIGGITSYIFTQTSIGMVILVKCACGSSTNVTDYDSW